MDDDGDFRESRDERVYLERFLADIRSRHEEPARSEPADVPPGFEHHEMARRACSWLRATATATSGRPGGKRTWQRTVTDTGAAEPSVAYSAEAGDWAVQLSRVSYQALESGYHSSYSVMRKRYQLTVYTPDGDVADFVSSDARPDAAWDRLWAAVSAAHTREICAIAPDFRAAIEPRAENRGLD